MQNKITFIYDDRAPLNDAIKNIVGFDSYGSIVYKRQSLQARVFKMLQKFPFVNAYHVTNQEDVKHVLAGIDEGTENIIVHFYSSTFVKDEKEFDIFLEKCRYTHEPMVVNKTEPTSFVFGDMQKYKAFLQNALYINPKNTREFSADLLEMVPSEHQATLSSYGNFLLFFSGAFDARHFNQIQADEYTVTKVSTNKEKIKSEYAYFSLIPQTMKQWFVVPFRYQETATHASYSMERIYSPDMALQWVHNAVSYQKFDTFLKKIFTFVTTRPDKTTPQKEVLQLRDRLYIAKLQKRIAELEAHQNYHLIERHVQSIAPYYGLRNILAAYETLYNQITQKYILENISVIGHGDLCFSNILYYKDINLMKFIDVKGSLMIRDIWTDPYYDVAKLSHSVCGDYDYFNNDMFDIAISDDCGMVLNVVKRDTTEFKKLFKYYLEKAGFSYELTRLYEASLFLSMLPLHMDNPKKVLGFILNALNIMDELRS